MRLVCTNSVDQRERASGKHWSDRSMDERVYYTENKGFAVLIIEDVRTADSGQYRCREDFKYSPTRNNFILLNIISEYSARTKPCKLPSLKSKTQTRHRVIINRVKKEKKKEFRKISIS